MPVIATATNPSRPKGRTPIDRACLTSAHARLVSLDGGVILAICLLLTAFFVGALLSGALEVTQRALLGALAFAAWVYLLESVTERIELVGRTMVRSSVLQRRTETPVENMQQLTLVHEGLNQAIGIESLIVRTQDGKEETISLGPCWRQRDLEAFIRSVERIMRAA